MTLPLAATDPLLFQSRYDVFKYKVLRAGWSQGPMIATGPAGHRG